MKAIKIIYLCLALTFIAPQAFGKCGWVLWKSTSSWDVLGAMAAQKLGKDLEKTLKGKDWQFLDAYETKKECAEVKEKELKTKFTQLMSAAKGESKSEPTLDGDKIKKSFTTKTDAGTLTDAGTWTYEYKCMPDTINPREK